MGMRANRLEVGVAGLVLLAALLAGCSSPPPAPAQPVVEDTPQEAGLVSSSDVANITQPEDRSDFAKSLDEKFHTHNYWGGLLEKSLMDADVDSSPLAPDPLGTQDQLFTYLVTFFISQGPGLTEFLLPEASIVPPETERLEVTVSWTGSPTITGMFLAWATADPEGDIQVADPFPEGGGMVPIATNLSMNDIPHTIESKWRFWLVPDNTANEFAPALFNGTVHVAVKAFRNDTLFVAPPHPDLWHDNATMPLFNRSAPIAGNRVLVPIQLSWITGDGASQWDVFEPPENTTIPPHTALLTATLTWTNNATTPDPFTTTLAMDYNPPNSFSFLTPEASAAEPGKVVYTILVDPTMWDSPYANQSQWEFIVYLDSNAPTDQDPLPFGDIAFFDGDYAVSFVAEREQV